MNEELGVQGADLIEKIRAAVNGGEIGSYKVNTGVGKGELYVMGLDLDGERLVGVCAKENLWSKYLFWLRAVLWFHGELASGKATVLRSLMMTIRPSAGIALDLRLFRWMPQPYSNQRGKSRVFSLPTLRTYWPHRYGIYPVPTGRFQDGTVLGRELILKSRPGINPVLNGFL